MINNIVNNSLFGEIILLFIFFAYIFIRIMQRKIQKREKWNNFESWLYFNLIDLYKYNWYPYPEIRARDEVNNIALRIKKECSK